MLFGTQRLSSFFPSHYKIWGNIAAATASIMNPSSLARETRAVSIPTTTAVFSRSFMIPHKQNTPFHKIVLDPGHGVWVAGNLYDSGALHTVHGKIVAMEKDLNMLLTQAVKDELTHRGYQVTLTHSQVDYYGKGSRHETLLSLGSTDLNSSDAFVSFHFNKGAGAEVIYNGTSEVARTFAKSFGAAIGVCARPDVRGLAVLRNESHIRSDGTAQPAILYEAGNIDNTTDRQRITDPNKRQVMAERLAEAIIKALPFPATPTKIAQLPEQDRQPAG